MKRRCSADRRPDLDDEPPPVQIVVEVEQMRLDPALDAVEVRVRANRDCRATIERPAGVDAVRRHEKLLRNVEVRGRKPKLAAASVPAHDDPFDLGRPPEQLRRSLRLAGVHELAHPARGGVLDEGHSTHVEPEPREQVQVALAASSETERFPRSDRLRSDPPQHPLGELLRRKRGQLLVERKDEDVLDFRVREQLEPALERGEKLDPSAEHGPGMRIERHDARPQPGPPCRVDHPEMPAVDAVEGPDCGGTPRLRQSGGLPSDVHEPIPARAASTRASTSASARSRSAVNASGATASPTKNGPTSVRRSVAQCPPSAIASDRTYVPELTRDIERHDSRPYTR